MENARDASSSAGTRCVFAKSRCVSAQAPWHAYCPRAHRGPASPRCIFASSRCVNAHAPWHADCVQARRGPAPARCIFASRRCANAQAPWHADCARTDRAAPTRCVFAKSRCVNFSCLPAIAPDRAAASPAGRPLQPQRAIAFRARFRFCPKALSVRRCAAFLAAAVGFLAAARRPKRPVRVLYPVRAALKTVVFLSFRVCAQAVFTVSLPPPPTASPCGARLLQLQRAIAFRARFRLCPKALHGRRAAAFPAAAVGFLAAARWRTRPVRVLYTGAEFS